MNCKDINELLSEYIDGVIEPGNRQRVEEHLKNCRSCREELSLLKAYMSDIKGLKKMKAPDNFLGEFHARLQKEKAAERAPFQVFEFFKNSLSWEFTGLAAALLLVFLVYNPFENKVAQRISYSRKEVEKKLLVERKFNQPAASQLKSKDVQKTVKGEIAKQKLESGYAGKDMDRNELDSFKKKDGRILGDSSYATEAAILEQTDKVQARTFKTAQAAPLMSHINTESNIVDIIQRYGGKIIRDSVQSPAHISAEIPARSYDLVLEELAKIGITQKQITKLSSRNPQTCRILITK